MANEKFKVKFGLAVGDTVVTVDGTTGDIVTAGSAAINGGQITTTSSSALVFNTNATTVNAFGAATTLNIGNVGGTTTVNGNLTVGVDLDVKGGDITNSTGALQITTTSNGSITLAPNGTGSVAVNTANGITTNQTTFPLVNATATTINMGGASTSNNIGAKTGGSSIISGNNRYTSPIIYNFGTAGAIPYRGLMVSNGNAGSNAVARTANVLRVFPTGAVGPRGGVIVEAARGNETTPTALQTNDLFGEFIGAGYATNSWVNDLIAAPASTYFYATENWANTGGPAPTAGTVTNSGSGFIVALQPTATNLTANGASRTPVLDVNPQTFNTRSDAYNFKSKANTNLVTIASDGQLQVFNTGATSNNNLYGYRTKVLSTTTENSLGNIIELKPGKLTGANDYAKQTQVSVTQNTTDGSIYANLEVKTQRFDGTNYSPTQTGDIIGRFLFNGNYVSGTTPNVGSGSSLAVYATENWTISASGTKVGLNVIKTGTNTGLTVLEMGNAASTFQSDTYTFKDSAGVNVVGSKITYNRVYGQWQNLNLITPAASNTGYAFALPTIDYTNIASVGSTSRIIPGAAGMYKLQFSVQVRNDDSAAEHIAYFWWRKNGTDVPNSMGQVGIPKAAGAGDALTIAGWDNMISSANTTDYWELMYAVDDAAHVDFPTFAATAFGPATAALFVTLVPIGA